MSKNLNEELYKRFGLKIDREKVESGFHKYILNKAWESTYPLRYPDHYDEKYRKSLIAARAEIIETCCRELFLDSSDYEYSTLDSEHRYLARFLEEIFDSDDDSFEQMLMQTQIFLNAYYGHTVLHEELSELAKEIQKYAEDFPMLGVMVKMYKTKAPQILPTTSKKFEEEIKNTLGLLESDKKYEHTLSHFESGLKEFLTAKTQAQYKDVIEDMYTACDDLVKAVLGNNSKGFKHISDKTDAQALGLNGHQKEFYKNLRNWMDEIKHSTKKDFNRNDTEMIISMVGSLIRFVISKHDQKT